MQSSKWKSRRQVLELGAAVGLTAAGAVGLFESESAAAQTAAPLRERLDRRADGAGGRCPISGRARRMRPSR